MTARFTPASPRDVARLMDAYPLAWIVSHDGDTMERTVLPLLAECDADGGVVALFGHYALANPQVALLRRDPHVSVLTMGPQGYVSPALVSKPDWGPTWNYATAAFDGVLHFVPEENDAALVRLAAHLERDRANPWTVDRMGARYAPMTTAIVAFRIAIARVDARFKLGQDESEQSFAEIVTGHPDRVLATWMRDARPAGDANEILGDDRV